MTISYVASSTASLTGGAVSVNVPAGVVSGDYMITILSSGNTNTITPPAGWTPLSVNTSANWQFYVYGKVASASEPASYSWTTSTIVNIVCAAYHSNMGPMSIDVIGTGNFGVSSTSIGAPSITQI